MSVADSLIAGESVIFASKKHWMAPIRASLVAGLMFIGGVFLYSIAPNRDGFLSFVGTILDLVSVGLVIAGVGWIIYNIVAWRTAEFSVTNMRVLREEGAVRKRSSTTLLSSLSDVRSNVGFLGGRLGYGDIVLLTQSGGAGEDRFLCITTPAEFRNAVMTQKMAGPGQPGAGATAGATTAAAQPPAPIQRQRRHLCRIEPGRRRGHPQAARRPPRLGRDHGRGLRGEEGRDPRPDVGEPRDGSLPSTGSPPGRPSARSKPTNGTCGRADGGCRLEVDERCSAWRLDDARADRVEGTARESLAAHSSRPDGGAP